MKVLTAAQMREVDERTIRAGIPGIVLMENAAHRVVEYLASRYDLPNARVVVLCGKGNNGGDGLAIARQLATRFRPKALDVVLGAAPEELRGDAAANLTMLAAVDVPYTQEIGGMMRMATLVIDAVLGTGVSGPARGRALDLIREINSGFPLAEVVAVDVPSGIPSDSPDTEGEYARVAATVTFTAPKICHALPPNCDRAGELVIAPIGSPDSMTRGDDSLWLSLIEPRWFRPLFRPRPRWGHKGTFGHVLVVAGAPGKSGAAAMTGLGALRAGAGLVTVATAAEALRSVAGHAPELMTEAYDVTPVERLAETKTLLAVGPGLGTRPDTVAMVRGLYERIAKPMVVDADGLNALAGEIPAAGGPRILTPHPGEMSRLTHADVKADRLGAARSFAREHQVTLVLKGQRTLIAFADGRVWINPTGTPAMATGGTGDILTGMIAGTLAQHGNDPDLAVAAAVWLHGRAGELAAAATTEQTVIATDLLRFLPEAMRELTV